MKIKIEAVMPTSTLAPQEVEFKTIWDLCVKYSIIPPDEVYRYFGGAYPYETLNRHVLYSEHFTSYQPASLNVPLNKIPTGAECIHISIQGE